MSNDTKYLDLDTLAPQVKRIITLNGAQHELQETSVEDFIIINKTLEELKAKGEETAIDTVNMMVDTINIAFPTTDKAELRKLSIRKLNAILSFTRGEMDKEVLESGALDKTAEENLTAEVAEGKKA